MSQQNKDMILAMFRENGKRDALDLRIRAKDMDGTAIIAEEQKIPVWDSTKDYSAFPVGSPVAFNGNVFGLLQPHNAAHYPDANPENTPAIWSVKHTKDAAKAKPWLASHGTSGMYMLDECCIAVGKVWRSNHDNNPYSPTDYAEWWDEVIL